MKTSLRHWLACAVLGLCAHAPQALAYVPDKCAWREDLPAGPLLYYSDFGTVYVPRDAPIGTVIGAWEKPFSVAPTPYAGINCFNDSGVTLFFYAKATMPVFAEPLPPINGEDVNGKVLHTSIPGVGVITRLTYPFEGTYDNHFTPVDGRPVVPFDAYHSLWGAGLIPLVTRPGFITLVKIGDIDPGIHALDGREVWHALVSDLGLAMRFHLSGTVIQAQCSLRANPVSADPVDLGEWSREDFTGPGFSTTAVPFQINLSDCADDPNGNVATAHIRLDGVQGSTPIEAQQGIFSLTDDSSATGVGIQMLMGDGLTPVQLGQDVPLQALVPSGDMALPFAARYYQTGASSEVHPGSAKGALSFTITYQ